MRLGAAIALSVLSAGLGASLVACFDLFHSTSGILDACQLDAEGCSDASPPVDFCTWEAGMPQSAAAIACTWIDTCEGPIDQDTRFGECMLRALLVFDCAANPNNRVGDSVKRDWLALLQAKSCTDVDAIVFHAGKPPCTDAAAGQLGCDMPLVTAVYCPTASGPALGDNCAMWGQTCTPGAGCTGCLGCFSGIEAGVCDRDASATCDLNDVATSCPNGALETIDCHELLQQPAACHAGPLDGGDPTSPCHVDPEVGDAGDAGAAGCVEGCDITNTVTACARGAPITFPCSSIDAGCQMDGGASCVFPRDQ